MTPLQGWILLYLTALTGLLYALFIQTKHLERFIMALVQIDQTVLDSFGTELGNIADAVQAIVDDPGNPLADADVSGITSAVARLQAAVASPETPVESAPEPEAPVE